MPDAALLKKLQVKGARRLCVAHAPAGFDGTGGVPAGEADVLLMFTPTRADLTACLDGLRAREDAVLWVAYPKLSSRLAGDMHRDIIRDLVLRWGLEVVGAIAIDADWSALRLKRVSN